MQKNDIFEAEIIDLTHEGLGVAKIDNFPLFIENALPSERVEIRVTKVGKSYGYARVEKFLTQSDKRVEGTNLDYLRTGIADLSHLEYSEQIKFKQKQIINNLSKIADIKEALILPTMAAKKVTHYRNKAQIPIRSVNDVLESGFFRKHSHDFIPIENFYIQHPEIDALILFLKKLLQQAKFKAYDEHVNQGEIRNFLIRRAHETGEIMLVIVVSTPISLENIIPELLKRFPKLSSVQLSIKKDKGNAVLGKDFQLLYGRSYIEDNLLRKTFRFSAQSFYQVNSEQAEILYQKAYEFADLKKTDIVIDAYAGIGTIGLCIADRVSQVYGMELVERAVENARENVQLNQTSNAYYEAGKAEEVFQKWMNQGLQPDIIFVDPPRKGLDQNFIGSAAATRPRAIIYISCNPATFSRDAGIFSKAGYSLEKVQPVDLFPQTHHVECIGKFIRNK